MGLCIWYILIKTPKQYIFTFTYDNTLKRYMVHGLWLDTTTHCDGYIYNVPYDPDNFIKNNWYDKNLNTSENKLFKYEYIKHGSCFNLTSTEYINLVKRLYEKYYDKYILNNKTKKKEIWLYLDENYDIYKIKYK